jgi:hypothetical protein
LQFPHQLALPNGRYHKLVFFYLPQIIQPKEYQMSKPEPPDLSYEVQIKHQYHAFLVANVSIHDIGQGHKLEIGLDGLKYTAIASQEAIRVATNLTGLWRATFYIRTKPNATLESHFRLRRLRAINSNTAQQTAFWTCTGKVQRVDHQLGLLEISVFLRQNSKSAFILTAQISQTLIELLGESPFIHVTGTIEQHHLVIVTLEPRSWVGEPREQIQLAEAIAKAI